MRHNLYVAIVRYGGLPAYKSDCCKCFHNNCRNICNIRCE